MQYYLETSCPEVIRVIQDYVTPTDTTNSFPVNFNGQLLLAAAKDTGAWFGKTISFNGEIIKIDSTVPNKKFLKVKLDNGQTIWVGDMAAGLFSTVGNEIRFMGYFVASDSTAKNKEFNEQDYLVISFASVELSSKKVAMYPGSEKQIRDWANGMIGQW